MAWTVYMLECSDTNLYTGITVYGVVCVGLRPFAGPQGDNLVAPMTGGDDDEEEMGDLQLIREFAVYLIHLI